MWKPASVFVTKHIKEMVDGKGKLEACLLQKKTDTRTCSKE